MQQKVNMRAIIYTRVSTVDQKDNMSLQSQQKACELEAKKRGIKKIIVFFDVISGASPVEHRPGLTDALLALKKGDVLIVLNRSRVARDIAIMFEVERFMQRIGAMLLCVAEQDNSLPHSLLFQTRVIDLIADHERVMRSINTKAVLQENKSLKKRVGTIQFGYHLSQDGIHIESNTNEQEIINLVHRLRKNKKSCPRIAKEISAMGYTSRKGKSFSITQIYRILGKQKTENDTTLQNSATMNTTIKNLRLQNYTLKQITHEIAAQGYRTKKETEYQKNHIVRILQRAHIANSRQTNSIPFGYQKTARGNLEICQNEQDIIKVIHKLRDDRYSLNAIVHVLKMQGYKSRAEKPFQLTQVVRILNKKIS